MAEIPLFRAGRCTVCDQRSVFVLRNRSSNTTRGLGRCMRCNSRGRNRHVALHAARSLGLASLGELRGNPAYRVLNTSYRSSIGQRLAGVDHITNTGFWPDTTPGTNRDGVRCEDLTALTYEDQTFDLVITEDVMEHVPDNERAFREIRRVLRPRGIHVFSIPFHVDRPSVARFTVVDGRNELTEPVAFHTDPGQGRIPVFHDYGYTLFDDLAAFGFETRAVRSAHLDDRRHAIIGCTTFVSRAV